MRRQSEEETERLFFFKKKILSFPLSGWDKSRRGTIIDCITSLFQAFQSSLTLVTKVADASQSFWSKINLAISSSFSGLSWVSVGCYCETSSVSFIQFATILFSTSLVSRLTSMEWESFSFRTNFPFNVAFIFLRFSFFLLNPINTKNIFWKMMFVMFSYFISSAPWLYDWKRRNEIPFGKYIQPVRMKIFCDILLVASISINIKHHGAKVDLHPPQYLSSASVNSFIVCLMMAVE